MNTWSSTLRFLTFTVIVLSGAHSAAGQKQLVPIPTRGEQPATIDTVPQATVDETGSGLHKRDWRYTVHPGDTLGLSFLATPDFNQTVTVQPDGYIALRDVGTIHVAGQTLPELTESVKKAYGKLMRDPEISVDAKDFERPYVTVGGQVGRPGKIDWRGDVTVTQAIALAGGFTDAAKHSQVLLFRRVSDQWAEAKLVNVKQMLSAGNLAEDPLLQPGDMLFVPKNAISKIKPYIPIPGIGVYGTVF